MDKSELEDKLKELALARNHLVLTEHEYDQATSRLQQTIEFVEVDRLKAQIRELQGEIDVLTKAIKEGAVEFSMIESLPLPAGIKIKNFHEIRIKDEKAAKVWAVQNAPSLVSYNYSKLKKAIENLELEWAEPYTEARAEIASNLDEYLVNPL